jgi:virginiamycin B lyase
LIFSSQVVAAGLVGVAAMIGHSGVQVPAAKCTGALFLGARGTNEPGPGTPGWKQNSDKHDPLGLGAPIVSLRAAWLDDLAGRMTVQTKSVIYNSTDVRTLLSAPKTYFSDLKAGVTWTVKYLKGQASACPQQAIILAGYSQGAMVMHKVLHQLAPGILARVRAAVLIADGYRLQTDTEVAGFGSAPIGTSGIAEERANGFCHISQCSFAPFDASTGARVVSVCNANDIVCDPHHGHLAEGIPIHLGYAGTAPVKNAADLATIMTVASNYRSGGVSHPQSIVAGPDGSLWFTNSVGNSIGKITTSGKITTYTAPGVTDPVGIAAGPDGSVWFTDALGDSIGKITTSGRITLFKGPAIAAPFGITAGPDNAMWFTTFAGTIGRISLSGHAVDYPIPGSPPSFWITGGPDGSLWFTTQGPDSVGKITTGGAITLYHSSGISAPQDITTGPDDALWFTNSGNSTIGRITTSGHVTSYTSPGIDQPFGITFGPDAALWFANSGSNTIGRISTSGQVTAYAAAGIDGPYGIAADDSDIWYTNAFGNTIGRNAAGAALPDGGAWGKAITLSGPGAGGNGFARVLSVSCPSAGNCSAGGYYGDAGTQAMVASEAGGRWGRFQPVPALAGLNGGDNAEVLSVSCASAGNCAAGGFYTDGAANDVAFVVNEVGGVWSQALQVPGLAGLDLGQDSSVTSVSCARDQTCALGGNYLDSNGAGQAFVASGTNGTTWTNALQVPNSENLNASGNAAITTVSCDTGGNCAAAGHYLDGSGGQQVMTVSESAGTWGQAAPLPGVRQLNASGTAEVTSLSCPSPGNCGAGGYYTDPASSVQPFVADETGGIWNSAIQVPGSGHLNTGSDAQITSISCAAPGNCSAGGYYTSGASGSEAMVASEWRGIWSNAITVPGTQQRNQGGRAQITSISCQSPGNCSAAGFYATHPINRQAFASNQVNGAWITAQAIPGTGDLDSEILSLSCPTQKACVAGGYYDNNKGADLPFVVSRQLP